MLCVVFKGAGLIGVIDPSDCENRYTDGRILLRARIEAVPVRALGWLSNPGLKDLRWIAKGRVKILEWRSRFEPVCKLSSPERLVVKYLVLRSAARDEGQPLQDIGRADIAACRHVDAEEWRGNRYDSTKFRRALLGCRPLIESGVRSAPHGDFPVAIRLACQPLQHINRVTTLVGIRCEKSF